MQHDLPIVHIIGEPELFKALLTSQVIWKDAGWGTIIFLAALSRIDPELYEAAAVDGAGAWQRLAHHAARAQGLIILLLILRLGSSLSVGFEQIILQQGPVGLQARRCSTPTSTTTASSAATGASRPRPAWSKGVVGVAAGDRGQQAGPRLRRARSVREMTTIGEFHHR